MKANWNVLTPQEERVMVGKGTEVPFTGLYDKFSEKGVYVCKRCEAPLYYSSDKFDPGKTTYEVLARLFFEIHDPTQINRQGPDIGVQYRSAIFYVDTAQKLTAQKLMQLLLQKGLKVATQLVQAGPFWKAEDYHQDYYARNGHEPYCHKWVKRF